MDVLPSFSVISCGSMSLSSSACSTLSFMARLGFPIQQHGHQHEQNRQKEHYLQWGEIPRLLVESEVMGIRRSGID